MNPKEYIESGILEAYVLGALQSEEQREVEMQLDLYPELRSEVAGIEKAIVSYCQLYAVTPPAGVEQRIAQSLPGMRANAGNGVTETNRSIPFQPEHRKPTIAWRNAAAVAVLICSLAVNYYFWKQGDTERKIASELTQQMGRLQADQKLLADQLNDYKSSTAMMADTAIQTIVMHTVKPGHPMAATLYWSKSNGEAYVAMDALPKPPEGMQYQLWVIQNGKPVSMGVLPNNMANTPVMEKVQMQVTSGDAFAISLERVGGNPSPTEVYVLGKA